MLYLKQVLNLDNAKLKLLQPNRLDGVAAGFLLACLSLFRIFFQLVAEIYQRLVGLGRCQTRWVFIGADKFDPVDEIFAHLNEVRYGAIPDFVQMRKDLVDWVEFVGPNEDPSGLASPKSDKPLIDLCDELEKNPEKREASEKKASSDPVETIRLKQLQLCVVKIQNLLKVKHWNTREF